MRTTLLLSLVLLTGCSLFSSSTRKPAKPTSVEVSAEPEAESSEDAEPAGTPLEITPGEEAPIDTDTATAE